MAEAYGVKQKIASKILFTTTLISIITIPLLKMFMNLFNQTTWIKVITEYMINELCKDYILITK